MTVIAYRDGILVGDSALSEESTNTASMKKVVKTPEGWLAGGAGDARVLAAFLAWAKRGFKKRGKPKADPTGFMGMAISPQGVIWFYDDAWDAYAVDNTYAAIGTGGIPALVAMDVGASAEDAVRAACNRVHGCALPLISVQL